MHKLIKSPIAPLFSLSSVVQFEGLVDEVLAVLSKQLDERFVATGETFDCADWLHFFAFDVMGTLSFSKQYGALEQGRDVNGMLSEVYRFFRLAAPVRLALKSGYNNEQRLITMMVNIADDTNYLA